MPPSHGGGDLPEAGALGAQFAHRLDGRLLLHYLGQIAILADAPAEWHNPAQVTVAGALIGLHRGDALAGGW
jgi:hypothetical protein